MGACDTYKWAVGCVIGQEGNTLVAVCTSYDSSGNFVSIRGWDIVTGVELTGDLEEWYCNFQPHY